MFVLFAKFRISLLSLMTDVPAPRGRHWGKVAAAVRCQVKPTFEPFRCPRLPERAQIGPFLWRDRSPEPKHLTVDGCRHFSALCFRQYVLLSFPREFWSQIYLHKTCVRPITTGQGAGFGPRIGKPAKIRHCPRNGKIVMRRNNGHWAGGAREGVAPCALTGCDQVRKPALVKLFNRGWRS